MLENNSYSESVTRWLVVAANGEVVVVAANGMCLQF